MNTKFVLFSGIFTSVIPIVNAKTTNEGKNADKPNIILFVADDHGKEALGCYGNPIIKTPNLDNLAKNGVLFSNAYCTSASSTASRSVILTGKYGHATASYGHTHDYHHFSTYDNVLSLPVILKNAGYFTARIGKYHVAPEKVYSFESMIPANPRSTLEMADKCQNVFKNTKPFFLYFCTDDPHRHNTPKTWNLPNSFGNLPNGYPGENKVIYKPEDVIVPNFLPDTKECREELAEYYQSVSRIDQGFGRLMQHLNESGKAKNTIVIYISDNGIAFPGAKTTLYDPGMHLPCIVKDPRINAKGIVNNAMINWADLTPTILDMTGADISKYKFHGRSFKNVLAETNLKGWDVNYASHTFHEITMYYPMRVVQNRQYKLIWNIAWRLEYPFASDLWISSTWQSIFRNKVEIYGKRKVKDYLFRTEFELFDMVKDPDEINNLAERNEFSAVLNEMKQQLKDFQKNTSDPWYIIWNNDSNLQGSGVHL